MDRLHAPNHAGTHGGIGSFYDDKMMSKSEQYPHCCAGTREGILHNKWSDAAAPPYSQLSGQNEPLHRETARDTYYSFSNAKQEKPTSPTNTVTSTKDEDGANKGSTNSGRGTRWWRSNRRRPINNSVLPLESLGEIRAQVDCPACQQHTVTRTKKVSGSNVGIWSGILCVLTSGLCACLPCIMARFKDTEHYCYSCGVRLATYSARGYTRVWATHQPSRFSEVTSKPEQQRLFQTIGGPEYGATKTQYFQQQPQTRNPALFDHAVPYRPSDQPTGRSTYLGHPVEVEGSPVENRKSVQWASA